MREVGDKDEVIAVDETSVYVDDSPRYGYTLKGQRCVHRRRCPARTGRVTLIMAVSSSRGVLHHEVVKGSVTSESFATFLRGIPAEPGTVTILDNARFHKTAVAREAAAARGLKLLFIPPYSPEFNPIEGCFSVLKQALRTPGGDLKTALVAITPVKVAAFLRRSLDHARTVSEG